jgi:hypothetical protein
VHQDVYPPAGWDRLLLDQFRMAERRFGPTGVAGVYGVGPVADGTGGPAARRIGWVEDRGRVLSEAPGPPAPMLCAKYRRVARARHANHAKHGAPPGNDTPTSVLARSRQDATRTRRGRPCSARNLGCVARAEHDEHADHGRSTGGRRSPVGPRGPDRSGCRRGRRSPIRPIRRRTEPVPPADRTGFSGRSGFGPRIGPHSSPAPMLRTKHRRVVRAKHAKHAAHGTSTRARGATCHDCIGPRWGLAGA